MKLTKKQKDLINNSRVDTISKVCMDLICERLEKLDKTFIKDVTKSYNEKVEKEIQREIEEEIEASVKPKDVDLKIETKQED